MSSTYGDKIKISVFGESEIDKLLEEADIV